MTEEKNRTLEGMRIGIFGKGGSGKSTFTVFLSETLARRGYHVCVLDADSTNIGLHHAFGFNHPPRPLMDYYGGMVFSGGKVRCPVDDPTPLPTPNIWLENFPHEYYVNKENGITLWMAGKIGDMGPGAGCDGPVAKIARDVEFHSKDSMPVTLVDFKAGFEDSARGAITSMDLVIVIVEPTRPSIEMAENMKALVGQIRSGVLPATKHYTRFGDVEMTNKIFRNSRIKDVCIVLNKVPDETIQAEIEEELGKRNLTAIGVLPEDPSIVQSWLRGQELAMGEGKGNIDEIAGALEFRGNLTEKISMNTRT